MRASVAFAALALLAACGGGGGGSSGTPVSPAMSLALTVDDVQRVVAQAVGEASARHLAAHVAVVDRVGNVLAIFRMDGASATARITSGLGVSGGLEDAEVPSAAAAVSKALTAAYLSSNGNAFTSRTANQIIQEHFDPNESQQPSGPLYGVQFSQLTCSDVIENRSSTRIGPRPAPLGLAADPGGIPLYKSGALVGGVGVELDGVYGMDRDIVDADDNPEEAIAVAGSFGFEAPEDIRATRITADGRTLRFADTTSRVADPSHPPPFAALPGALVDLIRYGGSVVSPGVSFGSPASGVTPSSSNPDSPWILVDASGQNRYPATAAPAATFPVPPAMSGAQGLTVAEVTALLEEAYAIARRARGQIRRPLGSSAEVSISVVGPAGEILGFIRTPDAPLFGVDVAVQKARTAAFFSSAAGVALPQVAAAAAFVAPGGFDGSIAWSARAIGNLHRPTFPDGIEGTPPGPFSTPMAAWSPFNVGLQEDLVLAQLVNGLNGDLSKGCAAAATSAPAGTGNPYPQIANGLQIFPGAVPVYRGNALLGAVGISGDGVDQDDMIAFLGTANAARRLGTGVGNAPAAMRSDQLAPLGTRLRYVQCPQSPFNGSSEQNVCAGL